MITLRMTTDVPDDRRVVLTLPPEVPTGRADLVVTVESPNGTGLPPRGVPAAVIYLSPGGSPSTRPALGKPLLTAHVPGRLPVQICSIVGFYCPA